MSLSPRLEVASSSFKLNSSFLKQSVDGLSFEDWCQRPNDHTNNLCWLVGHLVWSRTMILARLGHKWTLPWIPCMRAERSVSIRRRLRRRRR